MYKFIIFVLFFIVGCVTGTKTVNEAHHEMLEQRALSR